VLLALAAYSCRKPSFHNPEENSIPSDTLAMQFYHKADSFYFQSSFDSSFYYYDKALKLYKKHKDSLMTAKIYIDLATLDVLFRNYTGAENNIVKALTYLGNKNNDEKARAYNVLAINLKNKKDYDAAEKYFHLYRNLYLNQKDTLEKYIIYTGNLSNLYNKKKDYNAAKILLEQLVANDSIKDKYPLKYARSLNNLGKIYIKLNQPDKAFDLINKAMQIRLKSGKTSCLIQSYLSMALYYLKNGNTDRAKLYGRKALDLSKKTNSVSNQIQSYSLLIQTSGKPTADLFNKYQTLQDSLLDMERDYKSQTALIKYETAQKEKQLWKQQQEIDLKNKRNRFLSVLLVTLIIGLLIFAYQYKIIQQKNKQLSEKNFFINKLFEEMHHRIKNNFNIINRFIHDIIKANENSSVVPYLKDLSNKVVNFKDLHQLLKNQEVSGTYQLRMFVDKIFESINSSFGQQIKFENHIPADIEFEFNKIIYLGLLVNEFITNSFKYAFDDFDNAVIKVELTKNAAGRYKLIVRDNGKGLPDEYDWRKNTSFGMKYFSIIAMYLDGELDIKNDNGLVIQLYFFNNFN
jgi:two-component sensor histidine kinase/tetratricopeptide (TPR) repeat protein